MVFDRRWLPWRVCNSSHIRFNHILVDILSRWLNVILGAWILNKHHVFILGIHAVVESTREAIPVDHFLYWCLYHHGLIFKLSKRVVLSWWLLLSCLQQIRLLLKSLLLRTNKCEICVVISETLVSSFKFFDYFTIGFNQHIEFVYFVFLEVIPVNSRFKIHAQLRWRVPNWFSWAGSANSFFF